MSENWTEITAAWKGEMTFIAKNTGGGIVQMGALDDRTGVTPMQLLLVGLAGCTGIDIVSILQKKRLKLRDFQVKVRGNRAQDYPMIWSEIHVIYLMWGEDLRPRDVEQAIRLSEDKYCSVGIMLGKAAKITSEYHILMPGENVD